MGATPSPASLPPPAVPGPRNRTAAKWARKVANRQRAKAARRGWPDPWDDLRRESPQEPAADSPAPRAAGETEPRGPPSSVDAPPGDEAPQPANLAAHIARDAATFRKLGWRRFVEQRRTFSDFATLDRVDHPAQRLLKTYRERGAPVKLATEPWTPERVDAALQRGAHRSCQEHLEFLHEEFQDMLLKSQWVVLPAEDVADLPWLRISPPGVVPQRDRRPRWICDYTWSSVNQETVPLAPLEAMQFGHALDRILRELILADPALGPVQLLKLDISDGFYRIDLAIDDIPKLGVAFPTKPGEPKLVAFPLVLPMGWKNSPPIFSAATETIADLANQRMRRAGVPAAHPLDEAAEAVLPECPLEGAPRGGGSGAEPAPPPGPVAPSLGAACRVRRRLR